MPNVAPPPGITRAASKELNRRRLLEAARALLIECGYGALSARQVSARAGVAQSSFYAHFKDKEDLVRTLSEEIFNRLRTQLRETRQGPAATDWDAMVGKTLEGLYDFFLREREMIALLFQELDQPGSPIGELGQHIFDTLHQDFLEDLLELRTNGRIPGFPREAMVHLFIGTTLYIFRRILAGRLEDPMELLHQLGELNRAMVRGLEQR